MSSLDPIFGVGADGHQQRRGGVGAHTDLGHQVRCGLGDETVQAARRAG